MMVLDAQRISKFLILCNLRINQAMTTNGTVFIVDDNDDFRQSVAWMLRGEGYLTVEFACPEEAIRALKSANPSELNRCCVLLDVRMPKMNGLEFHEKLRLERNLTPVVYMTGHADVALAVEAMKKGAVTLLEKPLKTDHLNLAIETAISQSAIQNPVDGLVHVSELKRQQFLAMLELLTPREEQVLNELVNGKANKVIAYDFNISTRTVEVHRARLMKKLEVRKVSDLIKMVMICQTGKQN